LVDPGCRGLHLPGTQLLRPALIGRCPSMPRLRLVRVLGPGCSLNLPGALRCLRSFGYLLRQFSLIPKAPADDSTSMPDGGSSHAAASDQCPTRAASEADLRDHPVRLMKWCERHRLRRCCEGQRKGNSDQPDHSSLPCEPSRRDFLELKY
jgi:hypothetical protein